MSTIEKEPAAPAEPTAAEASESREPESAGRN